MTSDVQPRQPEFQIIEQTLQQAISLHQADKLEEAGECYLAILQNHPEHPEANYGMGMLAMQMQQPAAGLPYFTTALNADPACGQYWLSYIDALFQAGQLEEARQVLSLARQQGLQGNEVEALAAHIEGASPAAVQIKPQPTPEEPQLARPGLQAINALIALFNEGHLTEAAALAQEMTERFPLDEFGWKALGAVFKQMGRNADALVPMQKAAAMSPGDVEAQYNLGATLQVLGRLEEAETSYRRALQINPDYAGAHNNLGIILFDMDRLAEAEACIRKALALNPDNAVTSNNLGNILKTLEHFEEAEASYRHTLQIKPDYAEAHYNLGNTLKELGRPGEAEACYRQAIQINPDFAEAYGNLGITLKDMGRLNESEACLRQALAINPGYVKAHSNLGVTLQALNRLNEAEVSYRQALQLKPDYAETYNNLGSLLKDQNRLPEAETCYRQALQLSPYLIEAHDNLGVVLHELNRFVEAKACYQRALEIDPEYAAAHLNLAGVLAYLSDFDQVVAESDACSRLAPLSASDWERRLYIYSYHPDLTAEEIYGEFIRWGDRFPDPVIDFSTHDRTPGRRLRVGYVSPDFRRHTSRFFFWPLFAHHDRTLVELYAYSNVQFEDEFTAEFKELFEHWRNIRGVADEEVARMIREDKIDILVDSCNHMRDERLAVFALKPAPIQATWLGTVWTSGLKAMDYMLTDPYMAPEGTLARETIMRLPHSFFVYHPPKATADITQPPCLKNGYITFGYSGRTERLNHRTFRVWGEILRRIPDARLILDFRAFDDPPTQEHYRQFMAKHGMNPDQVTMRNSANIFTGLNDFDILLDSFPHNGGTMLIDALWMGVPALTLACRPTLGRIGASMMTNLGLPEWSAASEEDYIEKACTFAGDPQLLAQLRAGMRERMQNSPLMDEPGFARAVEATYRTMFEKWVKG